MYDFAPTGLQWIHDPFDIITSPIVHTLCGELTYEANFKNIAVDTGTVPMEYDTASRTYSFYSEDFGLIGAQTFTLEAHLTNYPVTATAEKAVTATIAVGNPCGDPDAVVAPAQSTVLPYLYTGATHAFTIDPMVVTPPPCDVIYSCSLTSGPVDICSVNDGATQGVLDPVTGNYAFESTDMATYPAGTYLLLITGTVGTKSDSFTLTIELVDPCPTALITLLPSPISDDEYVLRHVS